MRAITRPTLWTVALATALALPGAARAQQPLEPVQVSARTTAADKLDARAVTYEESNRRRDWGKAAGLREKAASMRAPEDPRGFKSLQVAAFLRHALDQRPAAVSLMQRAGDQAMARGDVFNAASSYVNVAFIAAEMRDVDRMREYAAKGALLMHSPLLSGSQRETLQRSLATRGDPGRQVAATMEAVTVP
jgi:hypothetical protein